MSKKSVFCFVTSRWQADEIVDHLRRESYSKKDISVLFSDPGTPGKLTQESASQAPTGAVAGAGRGDFIGEPMGWLAGIGGLTIPGVGPLIAAGPIVAALRSASGGGIAAALIGLGFSDIDARHYEREVNNGNMVVSVHTDDAGDMARVKDTFKHAGAKNICTSGESATKPHPAERAVA